MHSKYYFFLLLPVTFLLKKLCTIYPEQCEKLFTASFNKGTVQVLSSLTGIFPFSLFEIVVLLSILILIYYLVHTWILYWQSSFSFKILLDCFLNLGIVMSIVYFTFMCLWGFNYNQPILAQTMNISTSKYKANELANLYSHLVNEANRLRVNVPENNNGIMTLPHNQATLLETAKEGYEAVSPLYPKLSGTYGTPKPLLSSGFFNYTGITGIYFPFTGEANVNMKAHPLLLPATITHEMAHQRGFTNEDECNFIAYLTCKFHPDTTFQYSGTMLALIYTGNALYKEDSALFNTLHSKLTPSVQKDLNSYNQFWETYDGFIDEVASRVNDTYLKANGVSDGTKSYGRMVDLLLNYYLDNL